MSYITNKIERLKYWEETGKKCFYCNRPISFENITMDHVKPKKKKGTNVNSNLVIACSNCNTGKADKSIGEFEWIIKQLPTLLKTNLFFRLFLCHYDVKIVRKSSFIQSAKVKNVEASVKITKDRKEQILKELGVRK